ncbi:MAG: YCF48-related protein [Desulfomonilia bacterium]|jgi:photosystem II stability/assembly factor-like uncharacterized protein
MIFRISKLTIAAIICMFLMAVPAFGSDTQPADSTAGEKGTNTGLEASDTKKIKFQDPLNTPARLSALSTKRVLNDIEKADDRIIAVGIRGHIIYSDDNGKSWTQAEVPVSCDLTAVSFASPSRGWAVGHDGIVLHTADGGTTWTKQLDGNDVCKLLEEAYISKPLSGFPDEESAETFLFNIQLLLDDGPVNPFLDVMFENESTGIIIGAFNLIFLTKDGGKSWEPLLDRCDNPGGMHLYSIINTGRDIYVSGEQGLMLKFDRQAMRFQSIETPYNGTYFGVVGKGETIIAFGMMGNIYRSADSGASWRKIHNPTKGSIVGGRILENGAVVLVNLNGRVLVSTDEGMSFVETPNGHGAPLHAVVAIDDSTLIFAGWFGVQYGKLN